MLHSPPKRGRVGLHIKETFRAFIFYPLNLANLTDREDKRQRPFALDMANQPYRVYCLYRRGQAVLLILCRRQCESLKGGIGKQVGSHAFLLCKTIIFQYYNAFPGSIRLYSSTAMENINRQVGYAAIMAIAF